MEAVVADLDGDLSVGQVGPDKGGLDFHRSLFPGVQKVSAEKNKMKHPLALCYTPRLPDGVGTLGLLHVCTIVAIAPKLVS